MLTQIEVAAEILRRGGLVAFPTETVYGLGANALDAAAVDRIYAAKGRPATSPLIVHVSSAAMASRVVSVWSDEAERLAAAFWPGPLTLVLPKLSVVPDRVTAGLGTVGVRVPNHPIALELIRSADLPVAAPSANRFTRISPTTAEHVREGLGDAVDLILDGGPTQVGIESTVLSLAESSPLLLRPGAISKERLQSLIGPVRELGPSGASQASPGLHRKHYSPSRMLYLSATPLSGRSVYIWWNQERPAGLAIQMPAEPEGYARKLYAALHEADGDHEWGSIYVEPVPETPEWAAVRDRLQRAASR